MMLFWLYFDHAILTYEDTFAILIKFKLFVLYIYFNIKERGSALRCEYKEQSDGRACGATSHLLFIGLCS